MPGARHVVEHAILLQMDKGAARRVSEGVELSRRALRIIVRGLRTLVCDMHVGARLRLDEWGIRVQSSVGARGRVDDAWLLLDDMGVPCELRRVVKRGSRLMSDEVTSVDMHGVQLLLLDDVGLRGMLGLKPLHAGVDTSNVDVRGASGV